jgi:hypothetical protein
LEKENGNYGRRGFSHGMTPEQLKRIRELEKVNRLLKEIIIQQELEGKLKDELLKKKLALEKKRNCEKLHFSRREKSSSFSNIFLEFWNKELIE